MLLALAGSLALHVLLLAGLNFRPLPNVAFDDANVIRQLPLAVVLRPLAPLAAAPKAGPAASRAEPKTSLPPLLQSDRPAPQTQDTTEQAVQTTVLPRFDLDALRQQAREQEEGRRRAATSEIPPQNLGLTLPPPLLERDTPLSRPIAKAKRPDCKTTHSRWGLLGIPLLIYDTATDTGCQW